MNLDDLFAVVCTSFHSRLVSIAYVAKEVRFVSAQPMQTIVTKLEEIAKVKSFAVRRKDWRVSLEEGK